MASREPKQGGCCGCSCCISWGLSAFLLYYYIHASTPTFSIEQFDVFALKEPNNTNQNNTISYDMKLKNRNFNKGIYYDALNLTFYYKPDLISTFPIGSATFSSFYQGHKKATHRGGTIANPRGVNSTALVVFRVELATALRYKSTLWKSRRHHVVVGADLQVNDQGSLIKEKGNKGIKLSSSPGRTSQSPFEFMGMLGILILIHFWLI